MTSEAKPEIGPNDLCHCGSGKLYKNCHGESGGSGRNAIVIASMVALAVGGFALAFLTRPQTEPTPHFEGAALTEVIQGAPGQPPGPAPPGKVWSAEHGHWHNAAAGGIEHADGRGVPLFPPPPGPPPDGKVWSIQHGHWHDAPKNAGRPPGEAPPGKVWSADHGHWHDAVPSGDSL